MITAVASTLLELITHFQQLTFALLWLRQNNDEAEDTIWLLPQSGNSMTNHSSIGKSTNTRYTIQLLPLRATLVENSRVFWSNQMELQSTLTLLIEAGFWAFVTLVIFDFIDGLFVVPLMISVKQPEVISSHTLSITAPQFELLPNSSQLEVEPQFEQLPNPWELEPQPQTLTVET